MPSHAGHSISVPTSFDLGFFIRIYFFVSRRHIILFGTRSLGEAAGLSLDKYLVQCSLWLDPGPSISGLPQLADIFSTHRHVSNVPNGGVNERFG